MLVFSFEGYECLIKVATENNKPVQRVEILRPKNDDYGIAKREWLPVMTIDHDDIDCGEEQVILHMAGLLIEMIASAKKDDGNAVYASVCGYGEHAGVMLDPNPGKVFIYFKEDDRPSLMAVTQ